MVRKIILLCAAMLGIFMFMNCKSKYAQNAEGFAKLQEDIVGKFGADAYYTAISMSQAGDDMQGYAVIVDVTKSKEDIRQERWVRTGGSWQQEGYANMQIDARNPQFYKYQLGKEINLATLGKLIEEARALFTKEKKGDNPVMKLAIANTNNTVKDENRKYQYTVILAEKGSNDTHSYNYDVKGNLLQSN